MTTAVDHLLNRCPLAWPWRALMVLVAGGLASMVFQPTSWWWLLWPCCTLLLAQLLHERRRWRGFLFGWLFGFGMLVPSLYWISNAFLVDAERFAWAIPVVATALPAGLALFTGFAGLAVVMLPVGKPVARWLMLAVAWVVGEWLRGWVLTGFPWNLLGYAWSERLVPLQLVSLTGIFGLTLISLLVASAPALLLDSTLPTRLRRRVAAAVALLLLILVVALGWRIYQHNRAAPTAGAPKPVLVTIAAAARADVPLTVELVGTVVANQTVAIKSRLDSQVAAVKFHDGELVQAGQVLFELDNRALTAQVNQQEADLTKAKAQLENARLQYERAQKLFADKAIAQSALDSAKATYASALADVQAATAKRENGQVQLGYTKIASPITGRAGTINVTLGNNVKANDPQPLVTINQIQPIRVQMAIPQRYYDALRTAMADRSSEQSLAVTVRRNGQPDLGQGQLDYIDNAIDPGNGTFVARASFANQDERLWPGMFVNAQLSLGMDRQALTIPAAAVQGDEGKHFVFVVNPADQKAIRRPIELARVAGNLAIVQQGLEVGDRVISDGLLRVSEGVVVAAPAAAAASAPAPSPEAGQPTGQPKDPNAAKP